MTSSPESLSSQSFDLLRVLRMSDVKANIMRMFDIGTRLRQESAFAVYEGGVKSEVSQLLVPDPKVGVLAELGIFEEIQKNSYSVDPSPLIRKYASPATVTKEETADESLPFEFNYDHQAGQKAKEKIQKIKDNRELTDDEKSDLIDKILENDQFQEDTNVREDILLVVHNHPNLDDVGYKLEDLLKPSACDLFHYDHVRRFSPRLIEMIVATAGNRYGALIIKPKQGEQTQPSRYEALGSYRLGVSALGGLALAGYDHQLITMTRNGSVIKKDEDKVANFVKLQG